MENTSLNRASRLSFLAYFAILLAIGVWVRDFSPQPDLLATIHTFGASTGMGDPTSFASGALDIYRHNWFTPATQWLISLWPPGFMVLEGFILKIFGENAPFIAVLLVLSALLNALMLSTFRRFLLPLVPAIAAFLLPLVPFCFPVARMFLLQPTGLTMGEAFAVPLFVMAALLTMLATRERRLTTAILGGVSLALATYFRSQYELLVVVLSACALPTMAWLYLRSRWKGIDAGLRAQAWTSLKTIALVLVAAHVVMLPWRVHNKIVSNRVSWVATQDLVAANSLKTSEALRNNYGGFIVEGGGNLACILEPTYCGQTDQALVYRALFNHPGEWYARKLSLIDDYWFAATTDWVTPRSDPSLGENLSNWLLLLYIFAIAPLLWLTRRNPTATASVWLLGSFFICFFAIFTLVHLEARYFYLIKIFSTVGGIALACEAWSRRRSVVQSHAEAGHA